MTQIECECFNMVCQMDLRLVGCSPMTLGTPIPAEHDDYGPNRVLFALMRVAGVSDIDLAEAIGLDRQRVYNRRLCKNRIPANELANMADALGVPVTLFFGEPLAAVTWLLANRPDLFGGEPATEGGAEPVLGHDRHRTAIVCHLRKHGARGTGTKCDEGPYRPRTKMIYSGGEQTWWGVRASTLR